MSSFQENENVNYQIYLFISEDSKRTDSDFKKSKNGFPGNASKITFVWYNITLKKQKSLKILGKSKLFYIIVYLNPNVIIIFEIEYNYL